MTPSASAMTAERIAAFLAEIAPHAGMRGPFSLLDQAADFIRAIEADRTKLAADLARVEGERDNWTETARQPHCNEQYYRHLVVKIGDMLGAAAYTQDDGGKVDSVLCAKVPELVEALVKHDKQMDTERAYWKEFEPRALAAEAKSARLDYLMEQINAIATEPRANIGPAATRKEIEDALRKIRELSELALTLPEPSHVP